MIYYETWDEKHPTLREAITVTDAPAGIRVVTADEYDRLWEALTPSEATKQAYMGEFVFRLGEGQVHVPWVAIKEIMMKIRDRAALQEEGDARTFTHHQRSATTRGTGT